jgi:hypothetical protein
VLNQHSTNGQEELDVFRRPGLQLDVESREEELGGGGTDFWLSKILVGTKKTWTGQRAEDVLFGTEDVRWKEELGSCLTHNHALELLVL